MSKCGGRSGGRDDSCGEGVLRTQVVGVGVGLEGEVWVRLVWVWLYVWVEGGL